MRGIGVAAMLLALVGADAATAKKVKTEAEFTAGPDVSYAGGKLIFEYRLRSGNHHCRDALSHASVRLFMDPDPPYDELIPSDGLTRDVARSWTHWTLRKTGPGLLRLELPGTDLFATSTPGPPQYTGSYTFARWWSNYSTGSGLSYTYGGYQISPGLKGGRIMYNKFKVKYRQGSVKHVVKCVQTSSGDGSSDGDGG